MDLLNIYRTTIAAMDSFAIIVHNCPNPPILVCNKHVVVSYHHMKWSELVLALNGENLD